MATRATAGAMGASDRAFTVQLMIVAKANTPKIHKDRSIDRRSRCCSSWRIVANSKVAPAEEKITAWRAIDARFAEPANSGGRTNDGVSHNRAAATTVIPKIAIASPRVHASAAITAAGRKQPPRK